MTKRARSRHSVLSSSSRCKKNNRKSRRSRKDRKLRISRLSGSIHSFTDLAREHELVAEIQFVTKLEM